MTYSIRLTDIAANTILSLILSLIHSGFTFGAAQSKNLILLLVGAMGYRIVTAGGVVLAANDLQISVERSRQILFEIARALAIATNATSSAGIAVFDAYQVFKAVLNSSNVAVVSNELAILAINAKIEQTDIKNRTVAQLQRAMDDLKNVPSAKTVSAAGGSGGGGGGARRGGKLYTKKRRQVRTKRRLNKKSSKSRRSRK